MMQVKIDLTLTPENCADRGYYWYSDLFYDLESPEEVNHEAENLEEDAVLGIPASRSLGEIDKHFYGVYKKSRL